MLSDRCKERLRQRDVTDLVLGTSFRFGTFLGIFENRSSSIFSKRPVLKDPFGFSMHKDPVEVPINSGFRRLDRPGTMRRRHLPWRRHPLGRAKNRSPSPPLDHHRVLSHRYLNLRALQKGRKCSETRVLGFGKN